MHLSPDILGAHTVTQIQARNAAPLLVIGKDTFYRRDLSKIECWNFNAAANLSKRLKELDVKSLQDLYTRIHPLQLVMPRLGTVSLAVLGAAFETRGIGGSNPLKQWYVEHETKALTFAAMKHRLAQEERKEREARKSRTRGRKAKAHELRVQRFEGRTNGKANGEASVA